MAFEEKKRCCTWPRFFVLVIALAGIGVAVYFLTDLGDSVSNAFNSTTTEPAGTEDPNADPTEAPVDARYGFYQCTGSDLTNCCNGLDGLCELRADEILWGMSHNAQAALFDGFPVFPNHIYPLEESLDAGIRGLNIDVCNCGGSYVLCHGECSLGSRDPIEVFRNLVTFLDENPTEILLVNMELDVDADQPIVLPDFASLLIDNVPGFNDYLHVQTDIFQPWPTLGTLKETNKRMLLFHFRGPTCTDASPCPVGFHHWFSSAVETPYTFREPQELLEQTSCALDRGAGGTRAFFAINSFTTLPDKSEAEVINTRQFLEDRIEACSAFNGGIDVNVMFVDFWFTGDLPETVQLHNQALVRRRRKERLLRGEEAEEE